MTNATFAMLVECDLTDPESVATAKAALKAALRMCKGVTCEPPALEFGVDENPQFEPFQATNPAEIAEPRHSRDVDETPPQSAVAEALAERPDAEDDERALGIVAGKAIKAAAEAADDNMLGPFRRVEGGAG